MVVINGDSPWLLTVPEESAVALAIRDLKRDWYRVFGRKPIVIPQPCCCMRPIIQITLEPQADFPVEGFGLYAMEGGVRIAASTTLGLIYALYAFSEHVLGIDPLFYFTDFRPKLRAEIPLPMGWMYESGTPAFRYRGFFLNDEDLFSEFAPDPLGETVFSLSMWDAIMETLLRLRGNVIVPGTFTFPDESVRLLAARRGLAINDHHVTPLGLNTFDWPEDVPYSYVTHPEILEQYWRACVLHQKDRKMVWTISFRGKNDCAFWYDDVNAPADPIDRAKVIEAALHKQVEIIREYDNDGDIIFNMYNEQAEFVKKYMVMIPEGVIRVWPDDGAGLILDDGMARPGDGVYYHVIGAARNRLTEGVSLETIGKELGRFVKAGATSFCVVNVGNIRNVVLGVDATMRFIWNPAFSNKHTPEEYEKWAAEQFILRQYPDAEWDWIQAFSAVSIDFLQCEHFRRPSPGTAPGGHPILGWPGQGLWGENFNQVLPDFRLNLLLQSACGYIIRLMDGGAPEKKWRDALDDYEQVVSKAAGQLSVLNLRAQELAQGVPKGREEFFRNHLPGQIRLLLHMDESFLSLVKAISYAESGKRWDVGELVRKALKAMEQALCVMRESEGGMWDCWYMGERFSCVWHSRDRLREILDRLNALPVVYRPYSGWNVLWDEIYAYHKHAVDNYPFLHSGHQETEAM